MWELDCEEGWVPKNWCFWTVVLEKTLESPLDCKKIQPVYPKGNQSWIFIGKTNIEAEIPLPKSKHLLISWLQSPSAVILEPQTIKSDTISTVSPSISHEVMGSDAMIFVFWMLSFKPTYSCSSFTFIKRLFSSSSLSAIRVVSSAYLRLSSKLQNKFEYTWFVMN